MMKFVVSSNALLKELQQIEGILTSSPGLAILNDFLFKLNKNELSIYASDIETTIRTSVETQSSDIGEITIPAKMLSEMLKNFPDQPLTFIIDTKKFGIEINSEAGKYKIVGHDPEEFPKMATVDNPSKVEVEAQVLISAINSTLFAVANDDLRPVMTGVFCNFSPNELTFVATDAHRLVRYIRHEKGSEKDNSIIIAKKPLNQLKNILATKPEEKVLVEYNKINVSFTTANTELTCRLIDGKYPNYDAVIPKDNPNQLSVDRTSFISSLRRVSVLSDKTTHKVKLTLSGNSMVLDSEDIDISSEASERLACTYNGDDMEIGYNSKFLLDMLTNLDCEEVKLSMSTPNRAGVITPVPQKEGEDILMLVMPVMINS